MLASPCGSSLALEARLRGKILCGHEGERLAIVDFRWLVAMLDLQMAGFLLRLVCSVCSLWTSCRNALFLLQGGERPVTESLTPWILLSLISPVLTIKTFVA